MTIPLVPVLEPVPLRTEQPEPEFQENVVTFLAALPEYSEAQNAQATAMNETAATIDAQADQTEANADAAQEYYDAIVAGTMTEVTGTSASTVTVGTGAKSFTASTGKLWTPGSILTIRSSASAANYMVGKVTSYDASTGALSVDVKRAGGSGSISSWLIYAAGDLLPEWELIGSPISTATGTSWTISPLPTDYADLLIDLVGVRQSSGATRTFNMDLYDGTTWQSAGAVASNISSATPFTGHVNIWGYNHDLVRILGNPNLGGVTMNSASLAVTGGAKGIRFLWGSNDTGTAGQIRVWGK